MITVLDLAINDIESLLGLFKELRELDEKFPVPMTCFKKVVFSKLKNLEGIVSNL